MGFARVVSTCAAVLAVGGCTVVAVGMGRAAIGHPSAAVDAASATQSVSSSISAFPAPAARAATGSADAAAGLRATSTPRLAAQSATPAAATSRARTTQSARPTPTRATTTAAGPARPRTAAAPPQVVRTTPKPTANPPAHVARPTPAQRGRSLPLPYSTGSARRVITVVASHPYSTTARLQAWRKAPGGGWLPRGSAVTAHVGSDGLSPHPSEYTSATPIGSFTLTQAFGRYGNPGTTLPYFTTTPADWWISQSGPLYNTHQHCWSNCRFRQGAPNEHLYYELPFYNYAVVIDYNTRNAGSVRQGAGSAFFLHVSNGSATAGCVSIPQGNLVSIMRWLWPGAHPRILIGLS